MFGGFYLLTSPPSPSNSNSSVVFYTNSMHIVLSVRHGIPPLSTSSSQRWMLSRHCDADSGVPIARSRYSVQLSVLYTRTIKNSFSNRPYPRTKIRNSVPSQNSKLWPLSSIASNILTFQILNVQPAICSFLLYDRPIFQNLYVPFPNEHRPGHVTFTFNVRTVRLSVHRPEARTSVAGWTEFGYHSAAAFRIQIAISWTHGVYGTQCFEWGFLTYRDMKEFCSSLVSGAPQGLLLAALNEWQANWLAVY